MSPQAPAIKKPSLLWRAVSSPLLLVATFLMIIVAGQYMATLFFQNIIAGFLSKQGYGLFGVTGVLILLLSIVLNAGKSPVNITPAIFNLTGTAFIIISFAMFFTGTPWAYINQSFSNPISIAGIALFFIVCVCNIIQQITTITLSKTT